MDHDENQLNYQLADFLIQALSLDEDPDVLADEFIPLKRDLNAGISTIELTSSVGDIAFLLYHYFLNKRNSDDQTGQELFDAGLATLEEAAANDAPGPRLVVYATTDEEAFILATTPSTHRVLTGQTDNNESSDLEATSDDLPLGVDRDELRRIAARNLLRLLENANEQATNWLQAIGPEISPNENKTESPFNEDEAALALFLLDEQSIQSLLHALSRLINTARNYSEEALSKNHRS